MMMPNGTFTVNDKHIQSEDEHNRLQNKANDGSNLLESLKNLDGHFFQIAKVPGGVCKFRPAFLLDSVTFVAIVKCSQMQLCVGNYFISPKIRELHFLCLQLDLSYHFHTTGSLG